MSQYLKSALDTLTDMSPEELIGAVMIGLVLSLAVTGLYALLRRKAAEPLTLLAFLMLIASTASMAVAASYVRHAKQGRLNASGRGLMPAYHGLPPIGPSAYIPHRIFDMADSDRDGLLTHEEAAQAVALFMRKADANNKGSIDAMTLDRALWDQFGAPPIAGGPWGPTLDIRGRRHRHATDEPKKD